MIRLERVSKVYRRDSLVVPVLTGIDLEIPDGEFLALMGPSGSGKTTLLNLIAGLDRPTSGRVTVGSRIVSEMKESELATWRSQNVGLVFQLYNLIPVFTALENVEFSLLLTRLNRKARLEHARAALSIVGLGDRVDHYPRQLSGGQEQRVAIARAISTDPALLVADEPTGDLDGKSAEEILGLLNRLNREYHKTIVMVTHDPRAAAHAHRIVHLNKGSLSYGEPSGKEIEALSKAGLPQPGTTSVPVAARISAPDALETQFVQRVVSAMSDYAAARSEAVQPGVEETLPPPDAFEGLTARDILELTQRLEDMFSKPAAPEPALRPGRSGPRIDPVAQLDSMLLEEDRPRRAGLRAVTVPPKRDGAR